MHQVGLGVVQGDVEHFVEVAVLDWRELEHDDAEALGLDHAGLREDLDLRVQLYVELEEGGRVGLVHELHGLVDGVADGAWLEVHLVRGLHRHDRDEGLAVLREGVAHAEQAAVDRRHHLLHH